MFELFRGCSNCFGRVSAILRRLLTVTGIGGCRFRMAVREVVTLGGVDDVGGGSVSAAARLHWLRRTPMAVNSDYIAAENFGWPLPATTGAPGTQGGQPSVSRGDLMTVQATPPDGRYYAAVSVAVDSADTSGMSSDASNRLSFSGGDQSSASWLAGTSHIAATNPNAAEVPSMDRQLRAAR